MTNKEWETELAEALAGTPWDMAWPGVAQAAATCFADAVHVETHEFRLVRLSYAMFPTKGARRREIRRQLGINGGDR